MNLTGVIEANDLQKEQGSSYLGIKVYCSNAKELEVLVIPLLMIYVSILIWFRTYCAEIAYNVSTKKRKDIVGKAA